MNFEKTLKSLLAQDFQKVINKSKKFELGSTIYFKEIKQNIFLLFVALKDKSCNNVHSFIASFDDCKSIGFQEPKEILFYLLISKNEDLHYFEKYFQVSSVE